MRYLLLFLSLVVLAVSGEANSAVYYSKEEALALAFPTANNVEAKDHFLTEEQESSIATKFGRKLDSRLFRVYTGRSGNDVVGYAIIDSHLVRTLQQTCLIVFSPRGELEAVHVLAFHEPVEYKAPTKWLDYFVRVFNGKASTRNPDGIAGATLTSRAIIETARRSAAIYSELVAPNLEVAKK